MSRIGPDSCPNIRDPVLFPIQATATGNTAGGRLETRKPNFSPESLLSRKANCLPNDELRFAELVRPDASKQEPSLLDLLTHRHFRVNGVSSADFVSSAARQLQIHLAGSEPSSDGQMKRAYYRKREIEVRSGSRAKKNSWPRP